MIVEQRKAVTNTIYIGQTNDLRRRIFQKHFQGPNRNSPLRRKLISTGDCISDDEIQDYLTNVCFIRFMEFEDKRERFLFESFAIAVVRPKYNY